MSENEKQPEPPDIEAIGENMGCQMAAQDMNRIRNIGIIAHIDAGKTTTTERILYHTGMIHRMGDVDDGNTVTDFMDQERERGITIQAAAVTCEWHEHQFNLIDTPGHIDFTAEVQRSMRVLDGGIVVLDGVAGVEPQTETVWRQADRYKVPRVCFVNKMDRTGADLGHTVGMARKRLGANPIAIQIPIGSEGDFKGIVDLVEMKAVLYEGGTETDPLIVEIPSVLREEAESQRTRMIEQLCDLDDAMAVCYLESEEITPEMIRASLRRATLAGQAVPFLCGSAKKNIGVQPVLNAVVDYLPSPLDVPPVVAHVPEEETEVICRPEVDDPLTALVFKIATDPYMGRLAYIRVYSGTLRRGEPALNAAAGSRERIGRLVRMHADRREEIEELSAGDIGAVLGLKIGTTGDTICDPSQPVVLERIRFPEPVISIAISPRSRADSDKMGLALQRLAEEDPTLRIEHDQQTGETVFSGMGELHLEVTVERLRREFRVETNVAEPQVAYYETITKSVRREVTFKRQTGGHGQYAKVVLELEPLERGSGFEFEDKLRGEAIPRKFVPSVKAGIMDAMERGVLAKRPVVDVKVTLVDGAYHEVDSSDRAFRTAAAIAFREGMATAAPIILEPVMRMEVVAPDDFTGDVIGDLTSRSGSILTIERRNGNGQSIDAHVRLANLFGYATTLRSRTQGRGTFSMEFDHYAPVSEETVKELMEEKK